MNKLMMGVQRFLHDEEGTEVVEWALVAGLIVAIGAVLFGSVKTELVGAAGDGSGGVMGRIADKLAGN